MEEETRLTLSLLSDIISSAGMGKAATILDDYLERLDTDNEESISELNLNIEEYLRVYISKDVQTGARMVRLGDSYLPLNAIRKWSREESYSYLDSKPKYKLVLNSKESNPGVFDNVVVFYNTKEEREKDIEKLLEMKLSNTQL